MAWISFLVSLVLFCGLLLAIPLQFRVAYKRVGQDDTMTIWLKGFLGLWHFKVDIPMFDWRWALIPHLRLNAVTQTAHGTEQKVREEIKPRKIRWSVLFNLLNRLSQLVHNLHVLKRWFYKGIRCIKLNWVLEVGFKDAAYTGLAVGGLWSVIGYYLGKLHNNITVQVNNPHVAVNPSFRQACFNADIDCIFKLRIGHIIIAGFKVLKMLKLGLKGVKQK